MLGTSAFSARTEFSVTTAESFVNEDAGLSLGNSGFERGFETVVDNLLGGSDLCGLSRGERAGPAKHFGLERPPANRMGGHTEVDQSL
jgi:hypothetical protein